MLATIEKCTGCMACLNSCPVGCITNNMDSEGFYQPIIDKERCIECGKCTKSCPVLQGKIKKTSNEPKVYAAWNKDREILKQSSSGGIFGVFAKHIIKNGGVVFGAVYNEKLVIEHVKVESLEELMMLHGSKYVQSNIGESFKHVKKALEENRYVLFTGTPCQVAGLYGFLGGDKFQNLFTCDLICHGVPSPGVFKSYINYLETKEDKSLKSIEMRTKKRGWMQGSEISLKFENDKKINIDPPSDDPYMNGFMFSTFLRKSCYTCQYAKTPRESDITLADFWGIGNDIPFNKPTSQGVSLVIVNSDNGQKLFEKCNNNMFFQKRSLQEAKKGNVMLSPHQYINPYREQFFKEYQINSFEELIPKYLRRRQSFKSVLIRKVVKILGRENIKRIKRMIAKV
jgi:coenzyme F420-reducing hydrogenase beta subunit